MIAPGTSRGSRFEAVSLRRDRLSLLPFDRGPRRPGHLSIGHSPAGRRQAWHGGDSGGGRLARRVGDFEARGQLSRCSGRGRLRPCRHLAARRQPRGRRLHADLSRRAQSNNRYRLPRDRACGDDQRRVPRRERRGRSVQVALFRFGDRRAWDRRGPRTRLAQIRFRQVYFRGSDRAVDRARPTRPDRRRRRR